MNITVLVEDREIFGFEVEHGLSLYIEEQGQSFLLDTGQSDKFIHNAKKLHVDLSNLDTIILSHGHYDHVNGLPHLANGRVLAHPDLFFKRFSKKRGEYAGGNMDFHAVSTQFDLTLCKTPYKLSETLFFLGEIPRLNSFEGKSFPTVGEHGEVDLLKDDSGIVVITQKGLVVISGCAHSGICNTIEYAKKVTGIERVYAVLGGFHLLEINDSLEKTLDYFKNSKILKLYLGHCTSDEVIRRFKETQNMSIERMTTGKSIEL